MAETKKPTDAEKRDEVLRTMLRTPPKPHSSGKGKSPEPAPPEPEPKAP